MEKYISLNEGLNLAVNEIERKIRGNKLIHADADYDWMDSANYINGDPETIYSIHSLYAQFMTNDNSIALETELIKKYPQYV